MESPPQGITGRFDHSETKQDSSVEAKAWGGVDNLIIQTHSDDIIGL